MKLVIDIPEKMIEGVKNDIWCGSNILNNAIKTGTPYKEQPHGSWKGQPQRRNLVVRVCTSCGELSAVGNFCMWCGSNNIVEVGGDTNDKTFNKR